MEGAFTTLLQSQADLQAALREWCQRTAAPGQLARAPQEPPFSLGLTQLSTEDDVEALRNP